MSSLIEDIKAVCESAGVALYDTETVYENEDKIFRVLITSKERLDVETCAKVSRLLSPMFDVSPPVAGEYRLEVSSPGIERSLKTPEHFIYSVGEKVKITTKENEKFIGKLIKANEKEFVLSLDGKEVSFEYPAIKKARTYFEW